MQRIKTILTLFSISLLVSCRSSSPEAYFFISNTSDDKKVVDISVTIDNITIFNDSIKYSNTAPDLQYTPFLSLPKGRYLIRVVADSGKVSVEQPINLENTRWIFVSYSYTPPIDTLESKILLKQFGNDTSWVNRQLRGYPPKVKIHIMDTEPVHM